MSRTLKPVQPKRSLHTIVKNTVLRAASVSKTSLVIRETLASLTLNFWS